MEIFVQILFNALIAGSIVAVLAMSFALLFKVTKFFNVGHAAVGSVGAFTMYALLMQEVHILLSIIIGIVAAGSLGVFLEKVLYGPLRKRSASNLVLLITSFGVLIVIEAILSIVFTSQFKTLAVITNGQPVYTLGGTFTLTHLILFLVALLTYGGLYLLLKKTLFGRAIRAIGDDVEVAKVVGINTGRVIGYTTFIASALASVAAIGLFFDTGLAPAGSLSFLLKAIISMVIGGLGDVTGAFLGAYLLGAVENLGVWQIGSEWKEAVSFVLLIIFLLVRPYGFFGKKEYK